MTECGFLCTHILKQMIRSLFAVTTDKSVRGAGLSVVTGAPHPRKEYRNVQKFQYGACRTYPDR